MPYWVFYQQHYQNQFNEKLNKHCRIAWILGIVFFFFFIALQMSSSFWITVTHLNVEFHIWTCHKEKKNNHSSIRCVLKKKKPSRDSLYKEYKQVSLGFIYKLQQCLMGKNTKTLHQTGNGSFLSLTPHTISFSACNQKK